MKGGAKGWNRRKAAGPAVGDSRWHTCLMYRLNLRIAIGGRLWTLAALPDFLPHARQRYSCVHCAAFMVF